MIKFLACCTGPEGQYVDATVGDYSLSCLHPSRPAQVSAQPPECT